MSSVPVSNPDFVDLLQSAEQLTSECVSSESVPGTGLSGGSTSATTNTADLPRVQRNLVAILEAGQQLYSRTSRQAAGHLGGGGQAEVKASILLGSRGVDLPGLQSQLQSLSGSFAQQGPPGTGFSPLDPLRDTDIAGFLRNERENAILSVIEETRKETFDNVERIHWDSMAEEWEADKQRIMQALNGTGSAGPTTTDFVDLVQASRIHDSTHHVVRSSLDQVERVFAEEVTKYNSAVVAGSRPAADLVNRFGALFQEDRDREISVLWQMVKAMASGTSGYSAKQRTGAAASKDLVGRAKRYLEEAFKRFVHSTVKSNLQQARLGGIPGTFHLVRSFLNVKVASSAPGKVEIYFYLFSVISH